MMPNYYERDQFAQAHRQDLLREAEHERRLAQLPQQNAHLPFSTPLLQSLRTLSMKLRQGLQRRTA